MDMYRQHSRRSDPSRLTHESVHKFNGQFPSDPASRVLT